MDEGTRGVSPVRIVMADDEPLALRGIRRVVESLPGFEIVAECPDGDRALRAILERRPDLVLLDISMPGRDGFEVLEGLAPEERPLAIFVTAYDAHALQAFEVHALDYVLKPIREDRLRDALLRARARLTSGAPRDVLSSDELRQLGEHSKGDSHGPHLERLLVRGTNGIRVVSISDVRYLSSDGDYVQIHASHGTELMRSTLQSLVERLDPRRFVRVHRSHVVRIDEVTEVHGAANGDGSIVLRSGEELPVSRTYREALLTSLDPH
ncbi:MAG: response regulator transcription factor [Candidatus Eisenbacteria bacterium]|uniref:Response regulator transcription factor n=1 Tax=Eiseniibacteriota bacterium TaxID=2212470 RepID=A0A956SER9_UNCEI|nr:response regulator transcription factor [Candidatus Eisenbacteria bacterium]MCB9464598.1 response regulator transcription factor [Candidatus Eisenbacteria bacterium]